RFLAGEPILARPAGMVERAVKWARRRPAVAALLAGVVLATALGVTGIFWQWQRAEGKREDAEAALGKEERARAAEAKERARAVKALTAEANAHLQARKALAAEAAQRGRAEQAGYFHRVALAYSEWRAHRSSRADQLLGECPLALRHWEWRFLKHLCHSDQLTLHGHQLLVNAVAFSPDGKRLASVSGIWGTTTQGEVM